LVISIPPRGAYIENLKTILTHIKEPTQLILLSSTSVYTQTQGVVKEEDTKTIQNPSLMLQAERLMQTLYPSLLILRLGGLMGYNRIAGKYTAGKTLEHNAYVNYVHRDDVVEVITKCIEQNSRANIFNVVAPINATKKEVYDYNSKRYGFEKTYFESSEIKGKRVSSLKLQEELNSQHNILKLDYKKLLEFQ
jgi:nucleoside-diphosphate-sugar epimerase